MKKSHSHKKAYAAIAIFLIALVGSVIYLAPAIITLPLSLTSIGFSQGTQGFSFSFSNVYFNNAWWSSTQKGTSPWGSGSPSVAQFGYTLNLQPPGMPTLSATQSAFVPDISNSSGDNLQYTWMLQNGTQTVQGQTEDVYEEYSMELVHCTWSVALYLSGSGTEAGNYLSATPNWAGAQIWITLMPNEFAYFESTPNQVYFAPALIQVVNSTWGIKSYDYFGGGSWVPSSGDITSTANLQSVNPSNPGGVLGVYYALGGTPVSINTNTAETYEGQTLDPSIFRSQYYTEITLDNFQAQNWFGTLGLTHQWAWPYVQLNLAMYVWVVGQWQTYFKPGQVPTMQEGTNLTPPPPKSSGAVPMEIILILLAVAAIAIIIIGYAVKKHPPKKT